MTLLIDVTSAARGLDPDQFLNWSRDRAVFVSSVMDEFETERVQIATALRDLGLRPVLFEEFGGRDDDAERAFLSGVDQSDIYLGIVGDRYGTMQEDGRSATHTEFRRAKDRGKRISVWAQDPSSDRQGNERDFLAEIRVFHTTGRFDSTDRLIAGVGSRLEEMAADDESPWVKLGNAVFRADRIRDLGDRVMITATVRDSRVARYLQELRPDGSGRGSDALLTTPHGSGQARVETVTIENTTSSTSVFEIAADVTWGNTGSDPIMAGSGNYSASDLAAIGVESGILITNLPDRLQDIFFSHMIDPSDPLRELPGLDLPEGSVPPIARLLVAEKLVGGGFASHIDTFELGPTHSGRRAVKLIYGDRQRYTNERPLSRTIEGTRPWQ